MTSIKIKISDYTDLKLTESQFQKLSTYIFCNYGIKMPKEKKVMLQSRLIKRLRALNISNFKDYIDYAFSNHGNSGELVQMIDVVSTNKTDFFREPVHFEFMNNSILPNLKPNNIQNESYKVWSAGCSSGEEAYSIAITLQEWSNIHSRFNYSITCTDISTAMLEVGSRAIYDNKRVEVIPKHLLQKYFLKSKNIKDEKVRIAPSLRSRVKFFRLNFMDDLYDISGKFDLIFCRNTLIYFDNETQEKVLVKICNYLKPGGFLFIGHSESILGKVLPLTQIKPTIYIRD